MTEKSKKRSGVWKYFKYDQKNDQSICNIAISKADLVEKICNKVLKGQYPKNLKKHIQTHHKEDFKVLVADEQNKKQDSSTRKTNSKQPSIQESFSAAVMYDSDSKRHQDITQKLALFVGTTNMPLSLVDNLEFKELVSELDKSYKLPHRKKLNKEIENTYQILRTRIASSMSLAHKINLCCDIWSKPGMSESFLGITPRYLTYDDKKRYQVTLAIRQFPSPHTANRILQLLQCVLEEWNIEESKVFRVFTDNGSNMVAAFNTGYDNEQSHMEEQTSQSDDEEVLILNDYSMDGDCEAIKEFGGTDDELSDTEDTEQLTEVCVAEFDLMESQHRSTFPGRFKRNSWFVHTLQVVVKVFKTNPSFKTALKS